MFLSHLNKLKEVQHAKNNEGIVLQKPISLNDILNISRKPDIYKNSKLRDSDLESKKYDKSKSNNNDNDGNNEGNLNYKYEIRSKSLLEKFSNNTINTSNRSVAVIREIELDKDKKVSKVVKNREKLMNKALYNKEINLLDIIDYGDDCDDDLVFKNEDEILDFDNNLQNKYNSSTGLTPKRKNTNNKSNSSGKLIGYSGFVFDNISNTMVLIDDNMNQTAFSVKLNNKLKSRMCNPKDKSSKSTYYDNLAKKNLKIDIDKVLERELLNKSRILNNNNKKDILDEINNTGDEELYDEYAELEALDDQIY